MTLYVTRQDRPSRFARTWLLMLLDWPIDLRSLAADGQWSPIFAEEAEESGGRAAGAQQDELRFVSAPVRDVRKYQGRQHRLGHVYYWKRRDKEIPPLVRQRPES